MNRSLLTLVLGRAFAHFLASPSAKKLLDWRLGLQLLRDRRVPLKSKFSAVALGFAALLILEIAQMPLQLALYTLLPILGIAIDFASDGLELLIIPSIVALLAMQFVTPREIVERIRGGAEFSDTFDAQGRVYEAASSSVR